jgi:hypothetical protein
VRGRPYPFVLAISRLADFASDFGFSCVTSRVPGRERLLLRSFGVSRRAVYALCCSALIGRHHCSEGRCCGLRRCRNMPSDSVNRLPI